MSLTERFFLTLCVSLVILVVLSMMSEAANQSVTLTVPEPTEESCG